MRADEAMIDRLVNRVIEEIKIPRIELEASGRHVHLSEYAVEALFGKGHRLTKKSALSQPGQFACTERVQVQGPKGSFSSVVVLGPEREETQVEISMTDARQIGLNVPVRLSGSIAHTPGLKLVGPKGEFELGRGVIIAKRHIHMTPGYAKLHGFKDKETVSVEVGGERSVTFHQVLLRVSESFDNYMHIDYDEANACGFYPGMTGIIKKYEPGRSVSDKS